MGHFGSRPIRFAWSGIVLPSLLLNYAGQSAIVLEGTPTTDNIFYRLCPEPWLIPFVVLATIATIIASQSIITGAFSMTRQAIQLGWLPRLRIVQTSEEGNGQIYVGVINWLLMIVTVGLTLGFGKSDNLAGAYGIAVSATMMLTSGLLFIAMREVWGWSLLTSAAAAGVFLCIDACFFLANLVKVTQGGYVPLLLAALVYGIMLIWHRGSITVAQRLSEQSISVDEFMRWMKSQSIPRVPGTGVFLTRTAHDVLPVMIWHVKHNRALQENLFVLNAVTESIPRIKDPERLCVTEVQPNYWRATARFGFMEKPDIPAVLEQACLQNHSLKLGDVVYYVGHGTIVTRDDARGLQNGEMLCMATIVDAHVEGASLGQAATGGMTAEARPVYKKIELVGSSSNGVEDAVNNAITRAGKTIRNMKWFEVAEVRGHLENNKVADWQVKVKIGFTLDT
jgi:KUP system potassium uptake protein